MTDTAVPLDTVAPYDLNDRYRSGGTPVLLTGVQAIARLFVEQHERDLRAGRRVGTFVSGYQGSPLGGVDRMLLGMPEVLEQHDIAFVPGMNEEIAATSVWGSQTDLPAGESTHDGVVGFWYGKGPGVDRATDVLRHANVYGVNARGGAVLLVGDDPASKSSTVPAVSERSLSALNIPVFFPRNAREIVTMGLHAVALSRASGCVVAVKIVADVADGAWTVDASVADVDIICPAVKFDGKPFSYRQRPMAVASDAIIPAEADLVGPRWAVVEAYNEANDLDTVEIDPARATVGIVATGTTFDALRQALLDLGVDDEALYDSGIRLMRLAMPFPVGAASIRRFAQGLEKVVVVEDKTAFIETQVRDVLYGLDHAPVILGKKDAAGRLLMPASGELTPGRIQGPLARALKGHVETTRPLPAPLSLEVLSEKRAAYFCSGCPHNRSTAIPEGSIGGGGIGCHILVTMSGREDSAVTGLTQMGGEGSQWIGQAPFTSVPHVFQNIGDGTYFHSGQLALQACVAAGVNITYKLLYNDVVAMTGAQDAEGALSVAELTHKLTIEGVKKIIVCADEPERHKKRDFADGTDLWHRDRLDEAQKLLRDVEGVTVLIYDQHCAADARRKRKRGQLPVRNTRVVINEAVCEGCGDCGVKSNCLSVQPVETEFGRKTRIDQTSCNTDYSCLDGDCPSFVTVELEPGAKAPSRPRRTRTPPLSPDPDHGSVEATQNVFLAGIGGTGIVTVNQVLATAALRAGFDVESLDQIGLSQKAGPVVSHLRFSSGDLEPSNRLSPASADAILAFDLLTATDNKNLTYGDPTLTVSVASTSPTPTGDMVYDKAVQYPDETALLRRLGAVSSRVEHFDVLDAAKKLFGNTTAANFLLVGAACQAGGLRIPPSAIEEAIGINGVAVGANIAAFRWGRAAVALPEEFGAAVGGTLSRTRAVVPDSVFDGTAIAGDVFDVVRLRAGELIDFQSVKIARAYVTEIDALWRAERAVTDSTELSDAAARNLFKLTAYKDEYEVARMLVDPAFLAHVEAEVQAGTNLTYKLHPPALRALGRKKKIGLGPKSHGALKVLARGKKLRGTKLDLFGYAHVRKVERRLLAQYTDLLHRIAARLDGDNYAAAVRVAALPDMVRGYEEVKLRNVELYEERLQELDSFDLPPHLAGGIDGR